jgi:hypothetical protein
VAQHKGDLVRRLSYHIPESKEPTIQCAALCEYIDRDRWISQSYEKYDDSNQDGQQIENLHISPSLGLPVDFVKSAIILLLFAVGSHVANRGVARQPGGSSQISPDFRLIARGASI